MIVRISLIKSDDIIREIPLGDSGCDKSTEIFHHNNYHNTFKTDFKFQKETLREKARIKNFKNKCTPITHDNDYNRNKSISSDLNQKNRLDETNKSQLINTMSKLKKKVLPHLDIESIRTSNTEKIFCKCVLNAYNKHQPLIHRNSYVCECKNTDNCKDNIYTNEFNVNSGYI